MTNNLCHAMFPPIKMVHWVPLYVMLLQLHRRKIMTCALFLFLQLCYHVQQHNYYYFECNSVIRYVGKRHERYLLLTTTIIGNVIKAYRICQHFHYTVMLVGLLIIISLI